MSNDERTIFVVLLCVLGAITLWKLREMSGAIPMTDTPLSNMTSAQPAFMFFPPLSTVLPNETDATDTVKGYMYGNGGCMGCGS